ncbi:hypothetical protein [Glutamicibacter ardleyensis]|nr:hypothetical protein [Glutamicibacter ardleyensis]
MMHSNEIRLEALKLAVQTVTETKNELNPALDVLKVARQYEAYILDVEAK